MHPRALIRANTRTILVNASTAAGARVKDSPAEPNQDTELPAIGVYTQSDQVDEASENTTPHEERHELQLTVAGWALDTATVPVALALDNLADQIEAAMASDRFLSGAAGDKGTRLKGTDVTLFSSEGGDPMLGRIVLTYTAVYYQVPGVSIPTEDYLSTGVTTQIAGAGANNTVSDLFDQRP
jgi:hypothetical protein